MPESDVNTDLHDYIHGRLQGEARERFEERLLLDSELAEKAKLDFILQEGLRSGALAEAANSVNDNNGYVSAASWPWRLAAVVATVTLATALLVGVQNRDWVARWLPGGDPAATTAGRAVLVYLSPVRGSPATQVNIPEVQLSRDDPSVVLVIQLSFPAADQYDIAITRVPDGDSVTDFSGVRPQGAGDLVVVVPGADLDAGEYRLVVTGADETAAELPFIISRRD